MDGNNKELNINNNSIDSNNVNQESVVGNNENIVINTNASNETINNETNDVVVSESANNDNVVVEEVSFNYPEEVNTSTTETNTTLEDVNTNVEVSAPTPVVTTTIEEVSVSGTSLDEVETSSNSVFNKKSEDIVSGSMKEGQEHRAEKKGIPYGMLIGFGILIVCAFFIEEIVGFVEDYLLPKDEVVEENKKDDKETDKKEEVK